MLSQIFLTIRIKTGIINVHSSLMSKTGKRLSITAWLSVLIYGDEIWILCKDNSRRINAAELDAL